MSTKLPINLTDLLHQRTVEGERIEYKAGWNPDAIIRTVCAFANDFENLGGGYVVIGQDCDANGLIWFPQGAGGDPFEEKIFKGPLARMTREALVNAVYHRSYEEREPIEVRISHDELVVVNF